MIAGIERRADPFQVRLPSLVGGISAPQVGVKGEVAHRDALHRSVCSQRNRVVIEQVADQPSVVGMAVKDQYIQGQLYGRSLALH